LAHLLGALLVQQKVVQELAQEAAVFVGRLLVV